jgi:chromosome segregation ATPase
LRYGDRRVFRTIQQEDGRMDATAELTRTLTREDYTSRPGALIWFFRKSRNGWKRKHQDLQATVKGFKNQIAAVTKSREQWRLKAEQASERASALEAEVRELRVQVEAADKKNGRGNRHAEAQPG